MEIVGTGARGVAAEEDLGAVLVESVAKRVEDLRRHELPRHEHVRSLERLRFQHRLRSLLRNPNLTTERERILGVGRALSEVFDLGILRVFFGR